MKGPLVTLWKFRDLPEALLAKSKLEASGITAFLQNDELVRVQWLYSNLIGGILLQVSPEDADAALELLQEPIPDSMALEPGGVAYLQPRCPQCGSLDVEHEGLNKLVTFGTWLALGFPIRATVDKWRCSACAHEWQSHEERNAVGDVPAEVMTRIFLATTNAGKVKDFNAIARTIDLEVVPFPEAQSPGEVVEDGDTFEANAKKKAIAYSRCLPNELVLADDSGLEVDLLGGAPGVHSARYAQKTPSDMPSDSDNNYKLLAELSAHPGRDRAARFVCVLAAARDGKVLQTFRGEARGEILGTPIGKHGFGYDPLFYLPQADKTFAEMTGEEKARYSHRGAAFRLFLDWLKPEIAR